ERAGDRAARAFRGRDPRGGRTRRRCARPGRPPPRGGPDRRRYGGGRGAGCTGRPGRRRAPGDRGRPGDLRPADRRRRARTHGQGQGQGRLRPQAPRRPARPAVNGQEVAFLILALIGGLAGLLVVPSRNVVHAALWLVVALSSVAGVYLHLAAPFVAFVQVIIYGGASGCR